MKLHPVGYIIRVVSFLGAANCVGRKVGLDHHLVYCQLAGKFDFFIDPTGIVDSDETRILVEGTAVPVGGVSVAPEAEAESLAGFCFCGFGVPWVSWCALSRVACMPSTVLLAGMLTSEIPEVRGRLFDPVTIVHLVTREAMALDDTRHGISAEIFGRA